MLAQTVLPFKLESTEEILTSQAGLALVGEFAHGLGLKGWVEEAFPRPGSAVGLGAWEYVQPVLLMLHGGGRSLEDLRQIRGDMGLRALLHMDRVPSSDALGDWLRRMGEGVGYESAATVHRSLLRQALRRERRTDYTLDIDASQIVAEKQSAKWTYKNERGYMPMFGHLAENGYVVAEEFREGNDAPAARNLKFVQHCVAQLPQGKRIARLRADSAAYQAAIFNWCEQEKVCFAIGADQNSAVKQLIASIPERAWERHRDGEIAETVHCMEKTKQAFRLIVLRRPRQSDLFEEGDAPHRYTVIASNDAPTKSAADVLEWYCQRGECSENRIKELKIGFGMERMPCGQSKANAMFLRLGVLAYNLFLRFKQSALGRDWQSHQVCTVRWRLYQTVGRWVRHARQTFLKLRKDVCELFDTIRQRTWEVSHAVDT